jgi:hypothetical protein
VVCAVHAWWLFQDDARMLMAECYDYLAPVVETTMSLDLELLSRPVQLLDQLAIEGRSPLYQLMTIPFIVVLGSSEDAALAINIVFLITLMIATYKLGCLAGSTKAGLLSAVIVVSYPPIVYMTRGYLPHAVLPACAALSLWQLLELLKSRSQKRAWLFGTSLAFGVLIHHMFFYLLVTPSAVFGVYMTLFQESPTRPPGLAAFPAWLASKLRHPFVTRGLVPGALLALVLGLPWYLTRGHGLLEVKRALSAPALATYRGWTSITHGFHGTEGSFWWFAQTAPMALSNVLAVCVLVGLLYSLLKNRLPVWVLTVSFVGAYTILARWPILSWMYFIGVLPVAAVLSAIWIFDLRWRWLANGVALVVASVAVLVLSVAMFGEYPGSKPIAVALGSPLDVFGACDPSTRATGAFCPSAPEPDRWALEGVMETITSDPSCDVSHPCKILYLQTWDGIWLWRSRYQMIREGVHSRFSMVYPGTSHAAIPYNLDGLLEADYIFYPAREDVAGRPGYVPATVRFLESPPRAFARAHTVAGSYELGNGSYRLVKRVAPLRSVEAELSIAALDLAEIYKSEKWDLLARLYAQEGRTEAAQELYEAFLQRGPESDPRIRASREMADAFLSLGLTEIAIDLYKKVPKSDPGQVWVHLGLATAYLGSGHQDAAIAELETVCRLAPADVGFRLRLAALYRSQEELKRAEELYREVIRLDPENRAAQEALTGMSQAASDE